MDKTEYGEDRVDNREFFLAFSYHNRVDCIKNQINTSHRINFPDETLVVNDANKIEGWTGHFFSQRVGV